MRIRVERHVQFSNCAIKTKQKQSAESLVLKDLYLARNQFSGSLDLTRLPRHLSGLHLNWNSFSGTVDLSQLPQGLQRLYLSNNKLTGDVFISDALFNRVNVENTELIKRHME